jgi:hypothetical protein
MYIQPSFVDSCSDHGEWSGGNGQYRGDRSVEVVPTYINGRPNVRAFSDEAIAARRAKKAPSVPLFDRVLPQQRRVRVLTEQLYELETERKNGLDIRTYSQLRDVLICKRDRAEVLLKKALSAKPIRPETYEDEAISSYASSNPPSDNNGHGGSYSSPVGVGFFAEVVDGLSDRNSFKKILQKGCKGVGTLVSWSQQAAAYYRTLKEV